MALILRIDVDRPYGLRPLFRHVLSRLGSDLYFPAVEAFGYLRELKTILALLNAKGASSCIFFRRCTLPSPSVLALIREGHHRIGLHLEDSRSLQSFERERAILERHLGLSVQAFSKHGSGKERYGWHHYAPYEPDKYVRWGRAVGMKAFFGNLEDPSVPPVAEGSGFHFFPAAFWLEPAWRDVDKYPIEWLLAGAPRHDTVLLFHPENVLADPQLLAQLDRILTSVRTIPPP